MKKLIVAAALGVVVLNAQAFTVSEMKPSEGHHILSGQGADGLAKGCQLEEGEFVVCDLDRAMFFADRVTDGTCAPFGQMIPENKQPCLGGTPLIFQTLVNHKGKNPKVYENYTCALGYNNKNDLECFKDISNQNKPSFTIKQSEMKYWSFNAVADFFDNDYKDYWVED